MNFIDQYNLKLFDAGFTTTSMSLLQGSNVYNTGGYRGQIGVNSELEVVSSDIRYFGQLVSSILRLSEYRKNDLVKTVLNLYKDALNSCIDFSSKKLIEIEGDKEATEAINKALLDIDYLELLKQSLEDMIYYGSSAHSIVRENDKYLIRDLKYPFTTGYYNKNKKFLVLSDKGPRFVDSLIRFSFDDLRLSFDDKYLVDLNLYTQQELEKLRKDDTEIFAPYKVTCSEPLFLASELKLKDYVLKDIVSAFLSLINLIEQETFTVDGARITDSVNLIKLCNKIKGLLVTQDDMNLLASARLDKTALIRRLFDRVRVIPSIAGELNNLNKLEGTNLKEKLDTLNNQKEIVRDETLTAIGFPLDLYKGSTNRWEVGRQNDRYNIKTVDNKSAIERSTRRNVSIIAKLENIDIKDKKIKILFTDETPYETQNSINKMNNSKEKLQAMQDILRAASEITKSEGIDNVETLLNAVNDILHKTGINASIKLSSDSESRGPSRMI